MIQDRKSTFQTSSTARIGFGSVYGIFKRWPQLGLFIGLSVMVAVFGVLEPSFLSVNSLFTILEQSSVTAILAIGLTFVIIVAGIDLSFGSTLGLCAVVVGTVLLDGGSLPLSVATACAVGAAAGLFNASLTIALRISPLIITLGTMTIFSGLALLVTEGKTLFGLPDSLGDLIGSKVLFMPFIVFLFLVVLIGAGILLRCTRFGLYCLAIGGSAETAKLAGIKTNLYIAGAYVLLGVLAGLCGFVTVGRLGSADPRLGTDLTLPVIAAAVLGGANLMGGAGSVIGAALGAIFISTLQAGLTTLVVPAFYQRIAIGAAIILALAFERLQNNRR